MHEEKFLSCWLREERKVKEGQILEMDEETKEVTSKKRIRDKEKEENETLSVKRRCDGCLFCGGL